MDNLSTAKRYNNRTDTKEKVYYVGLNANNIIGNENFFDGSITIFPTGEKGNIFFIDKFQSNIKDESFINSFKAFIYKKIKEIKENNKDVFFLSFNRKIREFFENFNDSDIKLMSNNDLEDFLNNKNKTREFFKDIVPMLDYKWKKGDNLSYDKITSTLSSNSFVLQCETGSGGNETYYINSKNKFNELINKNSLYCYAEFCQHIPINITAIIAKNKTIIFPISTQLIRISNNRFKYFGGDFIHPQNFSQELMDSIKDYSFKICDKIKSSGYLGIIGIDYMILDRNKILFMEINPRFQSSSFLISMELEKKYGTNLAELHYLALKGESINDIKLSRIDKSFLNCDSKYEFEKFKDFTLINKGYFGSNNSSVYRKVFDYSVLDSENNKYNFIHDKIDMSIYQLEIKQNSKKLSLEKI